MATSKMNLLMETGVEFLKQATLYMRHLRKVYDDQMKLVEQDRVEMKRIEDEMVNALKGNHGNQDRPKPVDLASIFGKKTDNGQ